MERVKAKLSIRLSTKLAVSASSKIICNNAGRKSKALAPKSENIKIVAVATIFL